MIKDPTIMIVRSHNYDCGINFLLCHFLRHIAIVFQLIYNNPILFSYHIIHPKIKIAIPFFTIYVIINNILIYLKMLTFYLGLRSLLQ